MKYTLTIGQGNKTIPMQVGGKGKVVPMTMGVGKIQAGTYTGVYEVTPIAFAEQELLTANKVLTQNVIVHEIPYYETTNQFGKTVIIGD